MRYMARFGFAAKGEDMTSAPPRAPRDQAIDILRGLALATITINHLTGIVFRIEPTIGTPFPTLSHYGFSSAAELFFMLSGYLVGAVYLRIDRPRPFGDFARKMGARAVRLYIYNGLLFLALLALCFFQPLLAKISFYSHFVNGGWAGIASFATLYLQPYCLEILATYIVFLLLAPAFAWLLIRQPLVAVALSVGLYAYAYGHHWVKVPGGTPAGDWKWNFSPASWQFLFFGAMAAGRYRILDAYKTAVARDWRWLAAAGAIFAFMTVWYLVQPWLVSIGQGWMIPGESKVRAAPVRVAHALSVILLVLGLLWRWPSLQGGWIGRALGAIGAASLQAFVASVAISYVLGYVWIELRLGYVGYMLLSAAGALLLAAFALGYRTAKARTPRDLAPQPA